MPKTNNRRQCEREGCNKRPNFNNSGSKKGRFCSKDALPGMIDVINPRCERGGCNTQPNYNIPGAKKGRFCSRHALPTMVDVKNPICERDGCTKRPNFNVLGSKKGRFCSKDAQSGMVDIRHPKCENDGCDTQPTYNVPGAKNGRFCAKDARPGMVDVKNTKCKSDGCNTQPTYNIPSAKNGLYCSKHALPEMIDVKNAKCEREGCDKNPIYNFPGMRKRRFCLNDALPGMVDIMNPRCERADCNLYPAYNFPGLKKRRFCSKDALPGMIDVANRACQHCSTLALYGYPGRSVTFCYEHRALGTVRNPRKRCLDAGCTQPALYGIDVHEHCEKHRMDGEINILERECISCGLLGLLDKNSNCETCDPNTFKTIRLAKQNRVRDYLLAHEVQINAVDRMIDGGACGRERPDFLIDCGTHILVIEVDEHQHAGRPCECEQTRMVNISQSNGLPTIFLRYNPDTYKVTKGHRMIATSQRLGDLLRWTQLLQQRPPTAYLQVLYLFFDGFEKGKESFETIIPFDHEAPITL